jgi:hypothetical protein
MILFWFVLAIGVVGAIVTAPSSYTFAVFTGQCAAKPLPKVCDPPANPYLFTRRFLR